MTNNSNQSGALLLLAIVLGAAVYALMFFGSEMEQTNMSASFGQLSQTKPVNLLSNNKVSEAIIQAKEIRSDLSGISLPASKMKSTSGADYAQSSNPDFPSTGIEQSNAQSLNATSSTNRAISNGSFARNQSQSFTFVNSSSQYISNPQNPTKSDINTLLLLDTRAAGIAMSSQSSKRSTPSLAAKTASVSTSLTDKSAKKVSGDPGDPGASLPIGDGVWILLGLAGAYSGFRSYLITGMRL